ncbi:hypothetical protein [Pantoea conspicua]|uniref:hypothetical protein n=1 Tax=Pantoea conspicua TaxID=472705 RepID=UPI00117CCA86|nr:hypothetical protein [Pantoea conspicua]
MKRRRCSKGCLHCLESDAFLYERIKQWLLAVGARSGKACLIAKHSRIHADRPRHPWRGRFALQACLSFPVGLTHRFKKQDSGFFILVGLIKQALLADEKGQERHA